MMNNLRFKTTMKQSNAECFAGSIVSDHSSVFTIPFGVSNYGDNWAMTAGADQLQFLGKRL